MAHAHFMNLALAVKYGTNESLFLTNICFWIEKNKANRVNYHDGRYWVYNTMEAWAELFPYFSKYQIRHLIEKMRSRNILLVGVYNRVQYDRTQWYSVSDEVMALYLGGSNREEKGGGKAGKGAKAGRETPEAAQVPEEKTGEEPVESAGKEPFMCPEGPMEVGKVPHPSAPKGQWMCQNSQMEVRDFTNGSAKFHTTIPYNKPIHKPADAAEEIPKGQMLQAVKNFETAAAEANEIQKLHDNLTALDYRLVFDTDFYPKAVLYLAGENLHESYLSWLYGECLSRKPENLRGLFYALFFQNDMRALFREGEKKQEAEKPVPVVCPVCGVTHERHRESCPECNFNRLDAGDVKRIRRHKKFYELSPEDKAAYGREQSELFTVLAQDPAGYEAVKDTWKAIDKKYHLLE